MDYLMDLPWWVWCLVGYVLVGLAYAEWSFRYEEQVLTDPQTDEERADQKEFLETRDEIIKIIGTRGFMISEAIISFLTYAITVAIWPMSIVILVYHLIRR